MSVFVDTNILLRSVQPSDPLQESAIRAVTTLVGSGESLVLTPQIMAEFWNAATRPRAHNGFGLSPEKARDELLHIENFFSVLDESREVYNEWKRLIAVYAVIGVKTHDARLVAAMNVYSIPRILTFNREDFTRYKEVEIISPPI